MAIAEPTLLDAVELLRRGADALAQLDPAELADHELADTLIAVRQQMDRHDAGFARLAWAGHQRGIGSVDGAASTASFLRQQAGMREGDAKAVIANGEVSDLLAETGAAWRDGEISTGAMRTIVGARVAAHDDTLAAIERELLALARNHDLRGLRQAAAHFRNFALADGTEPGDRDGLFMSKTFDGRTVLSAELSGLAAETVATAIHAYRDPPSDDGRTTAQRNADAAVLIAKVALAHIDDIGQSPANVTVVLDLKTLTDSQPGRIDGEFTGPMHPQDVERLLCDSTISRVVTGPDSRPLNVGRAYRTPPAALRRAVIARDGGCRFPDCDRPAGWCQIHHTKPWLYGGRTDLDGLILLCDHHHRVIHRRGWTMHFDGHDLHIYRPDGTEVTPAARAGPGP